MSFIFIALYFSGFFVWDLQKIHGLTKYCEKETPVVQICTDQVLKTQPVVYVDTVKLPTNVFTCKCKITPSDLDVAFKFSYNRDKSSARKMVFKINDVVINESLTEGNTMLMGETDLDLFAATGFSGGVCMHISTVHKSNFDITCEKYNMTDNSTSEPEDETEAEIRMIIVTLATLSAFVCLITFVVVLLWKRVRVCNRRIFSSAEKKNEDNCYTRENPVYNISGTSLREENSESEYHYIESDYQGGRMSSSHYDILPDSSISNQFPTHRMNLGQNYDYTTCPSDNQENKEIKDNKDQEENKSRILLSNKKRKAGETMYDRTDTTMAKHFLSVNEYDHMSPAASRKKVAMDTYNTTENKSNGYPDESNDTGYHVIN